jgi:hypothetical protein
VRGVQRHFLSGHVFGISEGFRSHLVGRQVIQNTNLVLVKVKVTTSYPISLHLTVRTQIPPLGSLTSFRFRLFSLSASRTVLVHAANCREVCRPRGIFRSTGANILLRLQGLLLHRQSPRHALRVLFPILLWNRKLVLFLVIFVLYDGVLLLELYVVGREAGWVLLLLCTFLAAAAIRIAWPVRGQ